MSNVFFEPTTDRRPAAFAAYGFFLLSIPTFAVFAPLGAVVAWLNRAGASDVARSHFDAQLRLFMAAFFWGVALFLLAIPATILKIVLIGYPLMWLIGLAGFLVMAWFTIKSLLGLLRLMDGRPAAP
ncbi:MAG: hypothetical protein NW200_05130 [Hyphomonadaceae bacterium]|nr:hypothetical protein [Hyphomonadaceae bacterium]